MQVTELPFNKFIGLQESDNPEYLMMLPANEQYGNHLGTVHASALFSLAEATSGIFLLRAFSDLKNIVPVVRNVEVKYKKPSSGTVFSKAALSANKNDILKSLELKKRVLVPVQVTLHDSEGLLLVRATFEWFVLINTEGT